MAWIRELEKALSIDDLSFDGPGWENFSLKLSDAAMNIVPKDFRRRITLMEEKMQTDDRMLNGRQLIWLIFQKFKRNEVEVGMTEFKDLQNLQMKDGNLVAFVDDWDS